MLCCGHCSGFMLKDQDPEGDPRHRLLTPLFRPGVQGLHSTVLRGPSAAAPCPAVLCGHRKAQLNKSLLEEGTLQLSGEGLANGKINKTLSEQLDPKNNSASGIKLCSRSRSRGPDPARALCRCWQGLRLRTAPSDRATIYGVKFGPKPASWKRLKRV